MTYHDDWLEPPEHLVLCDNEDCDWAKCPFHRDRDVCLKEEAAESRLEMEREQ